MDSVMLGRSRDDNILPQQLFVFPCLGRIFSVGLCRGAGWGVSEAGWKHE